MKIYLSPDENDSVYTMLEKIGLSLSEGHGKTMALGLAKKFDGKRVYSDLSLPKITMLLETIAATIARAEELKRTGPHVTALTSARDKILARLNEVLK